MPDSISYRQSFPDTYVSISQHRMPFKGKFHKTPVHEEIIVGFQKKRKPGWLNISALFEKITKTAAGMNVTEEGFLPVVGRGR